MTEKQRKVERVRTSIPAEWGVTRGYPRAGKIVSLSSKGCLIRTDHVEPLFGKTIHLRFPLPDDEWMLLEGEVIYYLRDVGFAVEFTGIPDKTNHLLTQFLSELRSGDPYKAADEAPPAPAPSEVEVAAPEFPEKRKHSRARVSINVDWGSTAQCEYSGDRVTSLSLGGCFVQTKRRVDEGNSVFVRLWEMSGRKGVFQGIVRYQFQLSPKHASIGLGIAFTKLGADDIASLQEVLNFYGETIPS